MPQTLPGSSSASPRSQTFSYCPIEMQFTTRAVTLRPAWKSLQAHCRPNCQRLTESNCTSLRVYQNHQACFGKRLSRILADESNRDLARNSSTAADP